MNLINWRKNFHLNRSRQIARVLLSHGWNFLRNNDERIVGPTLAIADLLPPEYLVELAKLQGTRGKNLAQLDEGSA